MVMQEQSRRLSEPLRWTRTGRIAVIAAAVLLVAALATVAVIAAGTDRRSGCIEVTFASTLGAAAIHPCGAKARTLCANPAENPAAAAHGALRDACRQANLPYGQPGTAG